VRVKAGAFVENSILMFDTIIEQGAKLNRVITDVEVSVGANAIVGTGDRSGVNKEYPNLLNSGITLIGRNTRLPGGMRIGRNCIIYPNKKEADFSSLSIANGRTIK